MTDDPDDVPEQPPSAELLALTWRYAALIGIIEPDDDYEYRSVAQVKADREKWPHLIESENGLPVFDLVRAAKWMAEISGASVTECRRTLKWEWPS
jgi:hypothetical protein